MLLSKRIASALIITGMTGAALLSTPAAHATTQTCVDATIKRNLTAVISNHTTVTVTTRNNAPVCKDVSLYWDSYTVPATYDGKGFDASAVPQTHFDGTALTLMAGTSSATATAKIPTCDNYQIDLYYGPQIINVDAKGHGAQYITGELTKITKPASCDQPPVTPVTPTTPTTPTPPVAPVAPATPVTPVTPATVVVPSKGAGTVELPSTGTSNYTGLIAALLAACAYGAARIVAMKRA